MNANRGYPSELQFVADNRDWYICRLSKRAESADANMRHIIAAKDWIHEHCEPDSIFVFGGTFYFKHENDYVQFCLMWS